MHIYMLTTYQYDTYSYSGISTDEQFYFKSLRSAVLKADELGVHPVEYCSDPDKEATIEILTVEE